MQVVPDAFLVDGLTEDAVKDEELAAVRGVDCEGGVGGGMGDGALEALGDELVAGVVGC